jgi:response regulator RpfG family c-di-GMP phosphodiesterase
MKDITTRPTILLLGDESVNELLLQWLASSCAVVVANAPLQALQLVAELHPALLIFAAELDEISGIDLYDLIHKQPEYACIPALIFGPDLASSRSALIKRNLIGLRIPLGKHTLLDVVHHLLHEPHAIPFCSGPGHDALATTEDWSLIETFRFRK